MRRLLFALLLAGCGNPSLSQVSQITNLGQGQQQIHLVNQSAWPEPDAHFFMATENVQLQRDFLPAWGIDAIVISTPPPSDLSFQLIVLPDFSRFEKKFAAYHAIRFKNLAYVNYSITGPEGSTSSTGSHESLEMMANPTDDPKAPQICDPVAPYAYGIGPGIDPVLGQNMSNFVFPAYFQHGAPGPWDYMRLVTRQGIPAPGGFNFGDAHY